MGLKSVADVIYIIVGIVTLAGVLGGVTYSVVKASYNRARIEGLRHDNEDLRSRVDDLEEKEKRHDEKEREWVAERNRLTAENATLLLAVTQRAEVEVLQATLDSHHIEAMAAWGRIEGLLSTMVQEGG